MILFEGLRQRANFLLRYEKLDEYDEIPERVIVDPPCALADIVKFIEGKCPYSLKYNCFECISTLDDLKYIEILRTSEKFGEA